MKNNHSLMILCLLSLLLFMGGVLYSAGGDPMVFAEVGTRFSEQDPQGSEGYDGQFVYAIAKDPSPASASKLLDVPAYRYQRILLPVLAYLFSFGQAAAVAWWIPLIALFGHLLGIWAFGQIFILLKQSPWWALVYAWWVGFFLALRLDLPETLAYGLAAAGILLALKQKPLSAAAMLGLAVFSKEVLLVFVGAFLFYYLVQRSWRTFWATTLITLLPYGLFQFWLYLQFGALGIGSGGAMATQFEWLPFMGIFRIGAESLTFLGAILAIYIPAIILPAIWAFAHSLQDLFRRQFDLSASLMLFNALVLFFIPFSTYREPNATFRLLSGFVLGLLIYTASHKKQKALGYTGLYLVLNVFLFKL